MGKPVVEFEAIVKLTSDHGVVQALVKLRAWRDLRGQTGVPARLQVFGVRASEDIGLGGRGDLDGRDMLLLLLLLLVCRLACWKGCVEHSRVFVAAMEANHLLPVECQAGALGFTDHPNQRGVAERGLLGVIEGPAAS